VTTPLAWLVAAALWIGCLVPGSWAVAAIGTALLGLARVTRRPVVRVLVVGVAVLAVGSGLAGMRIAMADRGPLVELARAGGSAELTAVVVSDARPTEAGAWFLIRVTTVDGRRSGHRAMVRVQAEDDAPSLGSRLAFQATARPLDHDGFDAHLRRLHAVAVVRPVAEMTVTAPPPRLLAATTAVRLRVRHVSAVHLPADHAALLSGLVTGDTVGLSPEGEDALLAAGLTHLVAVSGSNVALVVAGTVGAAALCGLGARGRRRAAVVAMLWFAILVRGEPSVLRATAMALLVVGARASGRGYDARHTLAVAATLLLLVDPMLAGQLGFALSVLATGGVLVAGPAIAARIPGPRAPATLVGATLGAQLGVAPVLLTMEGGVPLGSVPANLVAVPAAVIASAIGVAVALVAQVAPTVASVLAVLARPALGAVLWAGHTFADSPSLRPEHLLSPALLATVAVVVARRRLPRLASAALIAVVIGTTLGSPFARPPVVAVLSLTALDVGQGDAMLLEVPGQTGIPAARMLVDGGPDQSLALRALRRRGVRWLDAVVVSHPHADHTDGLPAVLGSLGVGALLVGPTPPQQLEGVAASATAVEGVAVQRGVPVLRLAAGQRFRLGVAQVEVLSPPADGSLGREPNDNSLVLRVVSGDGAVLLTGDAEEAAQTRLLRRADLLRADLLKVPHHGGATNADGFLHAVGAHTAVVGVGAGNDYGHPHPDVLADLAGTVILRTDTGGTLTATVRPDPPP
jgi:competence protein ComEC